MVLISPPVLKSIGSKPNPIRIVNFVFSNHMLVVMWVGFCSGPTCTLGKAWSLKNFNIFFNVWRINSVVYLLFHMYFPINCLSILYSHLNIISSLIIIIIIIIIFKNLLQPTTVPSSTPNSSPFNYNPILKPIFYYSTAPKSQNPYFTIQRHLNLKTHSFIIQQHPNQTLLTFLVFTHH